MNIFFIILAVYILPAPFMWLLFVRFNYEESWTPAENARDMRDYMWLFLLLWPMALLWHFGSWFFEWSARRLTDLSIRLVAKKKVNESDKL